MSDLKKQKRKRIFNLYNGYCAYCGSKIDYDNFNIDHIHAKFNGGVNNIANKGRISEKRGIKLSKEHCAKIKKAVTGENNPMYGKKHSEATKKKLKEVWERRRNNG